MFLQRVVSQKHILQKVADGGVQRTKLSSALLECAETLPNLEIQEGVPVACSLEENPEVSIKNNVFHPKLLIGADGLHSRVRKLANLEAPIQS